MKHQRQLIRDAAKAALIDKTVAEKNVESNRPNPLSQRPSARGGKEQLPAIIIYTRSEKSEVFDESPRRYRRVAELAVEAALEITDSIDSIDDALDSFEQDITNALLVDDTLAGTADDLHLVGSALSIADNGEMMIGAVVLTFNVTYYTYAVNEESQELDDFNTMHSEASLSGQQDDSADRAQTDIDFTEEA